VRRDLVVTHYRDDGHHDHRLVAELTYNTFRDHLVLGHEIIKTDRDLGNANVYVRLGTRTVDRKVRLLEGCFGTQRDKRWFSEEAFRGLLRLPASKPALRAATPRRSTTGGSSPKLGDGNAIR
jgi:LmbE family N-acetylglucosaminyl deacetylase